MLAAGEDLLQQADAAQPALVQADPAGTAVEAAAPAVGGEVLAEVGHVRVVVAAEAVIGRVGLPVVWMWAEMPRRRKHMVEVPAQVGRLFPAKAAVAAATAEEEVFRIQEAAATEEMEAGVLVQALGVRQHRYLELQGPVVQAQPLAATQGWLFWNTRRLMVFVRCDGDGNEL
jgi:hypothetical protein